MELSTERLRLRPLQPEDLSHMQRYAVRPEFYRYLPVAEQTPETVADFLEKQLEKQQGDDGRDFTFALEPKDLGFIIGALRIGIRDEACRQGDLGFALDSDHQGRGYITEAVEAVLVLGFDSLGLHRIWATTDVENERSWRLMERVGMVREGRVPENKLVRGRWRDSYLYARLESPAAVLYDGMSQPPRSRPLVPD